MDFPDWVPNAVRVEVSGWMHGNRWPSSNWIATLRKAEADVQRVKQQWEQARHDDALAFERLRVAFAHAVEHRDRVAEEVACMCRLVQRPEMHRVYTRLLGLSGLKTAHLVGFVNAAWQANMNYKKVRREVDAAGELARKVGHAAGELVHLLKRAENFVDYLPHEFFSVTSALEKAEHDQSGLAFQTWREMRGLVLPGKQPARPTEAGANPIDGEVLDPTEAARERLRQAWATAPSMAQVIATLQHGAMSCAPGTAGFIGTALASRKQNAKQQYLRAFGRLLRDDHDIEPDINVRHAMAIAATVALNDPEIVVTYDDVRHALDFIGT